MGAERSLVGFVLGVSVLELAAGVYGLAAIGPTRIAFYACAAGLATAAMAAALAALLRARPHADDDGNGGGPVEPPPPWWPRFERDFRRYAAEREPIA